VLKLISRDSVIPLRAQAPVVWPEMEKGATVSCKWNTAIGRNLPSVAKLALSASRQ
jgi:hypothetical protein